MPFSMAGETAEWLRANKPLDTALIGSPDMSVEGIALYLGRPMHFLDCNCAGRFMQYDNSRDSYQIEQLPERLASALQSAGPHPAVLIVTTPLSADQLAEIAALGIGVRKSATFTGADDPDENFVVYDVTAAAKP